MSTSTGQSSIGTLYSSGLSIHSDISRNAMWHGILRCRCCCAARPTFWRPAALHTLRLDRQVVDKPRGCHQVRAALGASTRKKANVFCHNALFLQPVTAVPAHGGKESTSKGRGDYYTACVAKPRARSSLQPRSGRRLASGGGALGSKLRSSPRSSGAPSTFAAVPRQADTAAVGGVFNFSFIWVLDQKKSTPPSQLA